jgi:hypothetical protein
LYWDATLTSQISCTWTDADSYVIDCGNGTGLLKAQTGVCFYTDPWKTYTAKCYVNDTITSDDCKTTIKINDNPPPAEDPECVSLWLTPATWSTPFETSVTCTWKNGNNYLIDCGNGLPVISNTTWKATCRYTKPGKYNPYCSVDNVTSQACKRQIDITKWPFDAVCNSSINGKTYPANTTNWPTWTEFCEKWTVVPAHPTFPVKWWTVAWSCEWEIDKVDCSANRANDATWAPVCDTTVNNKTFSFGTTSWPVGTKFCEKWISNPNPVPFPQTWKTVNWTCNNAWQTVNCSAKRDNVPAVSWNPQCNTDLDQVVYPASVTAWPTGTQFCTSGVPLGWWPVFPAIWQTVTWTCTNEVKSITCSARRVAGDGQTDCNTNLEQVVFSSTTTAWPTGTDFCKTWSEPTPTPTFPAIWQTVYWQCNGLWSVENCSAKRVAGDGQTACNTNLEQVTFSSTTTAWPTGTDFCTVWPEPTPKPVFPSVWQTVYWQCNWIWSIEDCSARRLDDEDTPCAVDGTCEDASCGPLDGTVLNSSSYYGFMDKVNNVADHWWEFCTPEDAIVSFNKVKMWIWNVEITWYCGTEECSVNINDDNGFIKVYWSYFNEGWACEECVWFDEETQEEIYATYKFIANYDNEYTRSVMKKDYLPIWFNVEWYSDYITGDCNETNVWKFDIEELDVKFTIDGNDKSFNFWEDKLQHVFPDESVMFQAYLPANSVQSLSNWQHTIAWYITSRQVCTDHETQIFDGSWNVIETTHEYKFETDDSLRSEPFATQTFTVTDHYLVQQGSPLSSLQNTNIVFDSKSLNAWWITWPSKIDNISDDKITWAINKMVEKYKSYAVWEYELFNDTTTKFKKVTWQEVYYVDLNWGSWYIWWDILSAIPKTIIVENGNVTIWSSIVNTSSDTTGNIDMTSIKWPMLLIVKNWDIVIYNSKMNRQTILEWYYITDWNITVKWPALTNDVVYNNNPNSSVWYTDGRLKLNGVMIWNWVENVYKKRRSILKYRFKEGFWPKYAIENGASFTISSNPTLWLNAPVWTKDLFEELNIDKWY